MYGTKILSIRLARGYTQDYIAEKLNLQQNVYSKIERDGKIKMDDELLNKIAKALGVSIDDIKSPTPIIMNFQHVSNNQNNNINDAVIAQLTNQLQVKDLRISQLLEQNQQMINALANGSRK